MYHKGPVREEVVDTDYLRMSRKSWVNCTRVNEQFDYETPFNGRYWSLCVGLGCSHRVSSPFIPSRKHLTSHHLGRGSEMRERRK